MVDKGFRGKQYQKTTRASNPKRDYTRRNYEQFRWYLHLIINLTKLMKLITCSYFRLYTIIPFESEPIYYSMHCYWFYTDFHDPVLSFWPTSGHNFERHNTNLSSVNYLMTTVKIERAFIHVRSHIFLLSCSVHKTIKIFPLFRP